MQEKIHELLINWGPSGSRMCSTNLCSAFEPKPVPESESESEPELVQALIAASSVFRLEEKKNDPQKFRRKVFENMEQLTKR